MSEYVGRLAGHTLEWEGAAHTDRGFRITTFYGGVGGAGHGKCSCGALSPLLTSAYQRRAWHRRHKARIAEARRAS